MMPSPSILARLTVCRECPRDCGADRLHDHLGWCQAHAGFSVGAVCQHRGEEPVFGPAGICNVFFTHCNLQCCYCQNFQISNKTAPTIAHTLTLEALTAKIVTILEQGTRFVGFVSPSHVFPQMELLMETLRSHPSKPIFVMNTNGYDRPEQIARLEGRMDVYLPDLKYMDSQLASRLSACSDYPNVAQHALREMFRQKGSVLDLDEAGVIRSGLIIRHLVLPGEVENSKAVLRFIAHELSPHISVALMSQYTPTPAVKNDPRLRRRVSESEYTEVLEELDALGMENGWVQALDSQDHYCPDFAQSHPFEP